jgi:hypothetical protein
MRRSADGSGDLNGAVGVASSLELKGALCVSLMIRILVLTVDAMVVFGNGCSVQITGQCLFLAWYSYDDDIDDVHSCCC